MGRKIEFTEAMDATVFDLRSRGVSLDTIGEVLGMSRTTVAERLRERWWGSDLIKPVRPGPPPQRAKPVVGVHPRDHTGAMLAGDPVPWNILTAGTLLEGVPFPLDPVTRLPR